MTYYAKRLKDNRVEVRSNNLSLFCDPRYGGAPLSWKYKGVELIDTFPGSGAQATWEYGQDSTQATCNGPLQNPIAQLNKVNTQYSYYGRERTLLTVNSVYKTQAFCPAFWLSHEAQDDAIPDESKHQWCTRYNNFLGYTDTVWSGVDTPIFFKGSEQKPAGMFFVGNEMASIAEHWSRRLAPFRYGNVAAKIRISLKQASSDAYAGIVFRKEDAAMNEAAAYSAPGYHLLVNKLGYWNLHKLPTGEIVVGGRLSFLSRTRLNSNSGILLEVRTHTVLPNIIQILCDGKLLADLNEHQPILGNTFGLLAACNSGIIKFSDRQVFDLNHELVMEVSSDEQYVYLAYTLYPAAGVTWPKKLYRCNMGVFFFNPLLLSYTQYGGNPDKDPGIVRIFKDDSLILISEKYNIKLRLDIRRIGRNFGQHPHALLGRSAIPNQSIIHVNTLSVEANNDPVAVSSNSITLAIKATSWK